MAAEPPLIGIRTRSLAAHAARIRLRYPEKRIPAARKGIGRRDVYGSLPNTAALSGAYSRTLVRADDVQRTWRWAADPGRVIRGRQQDACAAGSAGVSGRGRELPQCDRT